jgi:hypothetical protein
MGTHPEIRWGKCRVLRFQEWRPLYAYVANALLKPSAPKAAIPDVTGKGGGLSGRGLLQGLGADQFETDTGAQTQNITELDIQIPERLE